jgi:hypothetical protein
MKAKIENGKVAQASGLSVAWSLQARRLRYVPVLAL